MADCFLTWSRNAVVVSHSYPNKSLLLTAGAKDILQTCVVANYFSAQFPLNMHARTRTDLVRLLNKSANFVVNFKSAF